MSQETIANLEQFYSTHRVFYGGEDYACICDKIYCKTNGSTKVFSFFPHVEPDSKPWISEIKKEANRKRLKIFLVALATSVALIPVYVGIAGVIGSLIFLFASRKTMVAKQRNKQMEIYGSTVMESFRQCILLPEDISQEQNTETIWRLYLHQWLCGKIFDLQEIRENKILLLDKLRGEMAYDWNFETEDLVVDRYEPKLIRILLRVRMFRPEKIGVLSTAYLIKHAQAFSGEYPEEAFDANELLRGADVFTRRAVQWIFEFNNVKPEAIACGEEPDDVFLSNLIPQMQLVKYKGKLRVCPCAMQRSYYALIHKLLLEEKTAVSQTAPT